MKILSGKGGNAIITVLAVMLGVLLGVLVHSSGHRAEAVIGGVGNVTDPDNPHNLSNTSSGIRAVDETQVCIFCHTPHMALTDSSLLNAPLWNHTLSTLSYKVKTTGSQYTNSAFGITVNLISTPPVQPDGTSKMCLSCHDGSVALGDIESRSSEIDMYDVVNSCISTADKLVSGSGCSAYIGNDLTNKHVVSVPMNQALITASAYNCGGPVTHKLQYPWDAGASEVLLRPTSTRYPPSTGAMGTTRITGKYKAGYNYGVQCSTCHDPHLWGDGASANSRGWKFLVTDFNTLCGACHTSCT